MDWNSELEKNRKLDIENLVRGRNSLTYAELLTLVPEIEEHLDELSTLLDALDEKGVVLIGEEDVLESKHDVPKGETADLDRINTDDLLDIYLAEMAQTPLLTFDEEIALAQQIELGRQAQRAIKESDYTAGAYERLQAQVEIGQVARERLSRANTRLVISIAKRYRGYGLPFNDLIQEGNVGLMRAVDRYKADSGNRFSTYATWWIRQAVTRSLANNGRVIRIPVHMGGQMRGMARVSQRLEMEWGRQPSAHEIASEMGESPDRIRQLMRWADHPLSLEQPVSEEGDLVLGETIKDDNAPLPDEITDARVLGEKLESLLNSLPAREERILRLRYGLEDGEARTLQEVADKFGLSRERIRQLEREALAKLRLVARRFRLEDYATAE
jgi:RNA polymerase primary sigma factor